MSRTTARIVACLALPAVLLGCSDDEPVRPVGEPTTAPAPAASPAAVPAPESPAPGATPPAGSDAGASRSNPPTPPEPPTPGVAGDASARLAAYSRTLDQHADKLRGMTMAAGFLNDETFNELVSVCSNAVEEAQATLYELEQVGGDDPALLDELEQQVQQVVEADAAAVARLEKVRNG